MYCIGLTGNIASGKSTVAGYFAALGVDVINADDIAKELTAKDEPAFDDIIRHFGKTVLTASGELNRRHLRQLVFDNSQERLWLEKLLHPLIRNQIEYRIRNVKSPYCIIEIPLLLDRNNYPYLNRVLLVQADLKQQIERFMARDSGSEHDARAILATQADDAKRQAWADDILLNTGSLSTLEDKVAALHAKFVHYAKRH